MVAPTVSTKFLSDRRLAAGQGLISNQYFLRAFLSSELLLRIKECTV